MMKPGMNQPIRWNSRLTEDQASLSPVGKGGEGETKEEDDEEGREREKKKECRKGRRPMKQQSVTIVELKNVDFHRGDANNRSRC